MNIPPPGPKAQGEPSLPTVDPASETLQGHDRLPFDPKPLAAYRFGRGSFDVWLWHNVFWVVPGGESTWYGVPLAVERLRDDRLILADVIHQNVFAELPRVLDDLDNMADVLVMAWRETGKYREQEFGSRIVPGRRHWEELRILADRALAFGDPLRSIFDFGAAVGEYQLRLWEHGAGSEQPPELDTVPAILPLISRAQNLPDDLLRRIPQLRSLVDLSPELEHDDQESHIRKYIGRQPKASSFYDKDREIDIPIASQLIDDLDCSVEDGLRSDPVNSGLLRLLAEPPKPIWDSERRHLLFEGKIVRIVKRRGTDIEVVLNAFQNDKWPDTLLNPFLNDEHLTDAKIHELIDSLNCGLVAIKFHGDGTGRGIFWGLAPAPGTP